MASGKLIGRADYSCMLSSMTCAPPITWLFACWKPGAISPCLPKKCSPSPTAPTRSVSIPDNPRWCTGRAGSPGNRYGPGSPDTHPDRHAVPRSVVTLYWKSTEEAVPITPQFTEGSALSYLVVEPISLDLVSLTLAHIFETSSMKIGSSPLKDKKCLHLIL